MLTDGFTRSASGWEVIDNKSKIHATYPNNSLFQSPALMILEDKLDTAWNERVEWIEYLDFHLFTKTNTIEKVKREGDVE